VGLAASYAEIAPSAGMDSGSGLIRKTVHGRLVGLSHATFPPGYASRPHSHEGEELSRLIEGEVSIFMVSPTQPGTSGTEFRLAAGDYMRIPAMAVHWKRNTSSAPAVMIELHNPPLLEPLSRELLDPFERHDGSFGHSEAIRFGKTYRASDYFAEAAFTPAAEDHYLLMRDKAASTRFGTARTAKVHSNGEPITTHIVGGESMSIMFTVRDGYKARPHFHASEQLSYVIDGEIWTFIEGRAFRSPAGDFVRVPGNADHWAMATPGKPAVVFEVHTPLQNDPATANRVHLVPPHRVPLLPWIPGGHPSDAPSSDELEKLEAEMKRAANQADRQRNPAAGRPQ
jgi:quercetin dioxygenase-like cupin family protein